MINKPETQRNKKEPCSFLDDLLAIFKYVTMLLYIIKETLLTNAQTHRQLWKDMRRKKKQIFKVFNMFLVC